MMKVYIKGKSRRAEDREIKTTVYHILKNTEAIGNRTIDYQKLVNRVYEHLDEIRLNVSKDRIIEVIDEMLLEDMIYRVTTSKGMRVGLV